MLLFAMRSVFATTVGSTILLLLTACGGSNASTAAKQEERPGVGTWTLLHAESTGVTEATWNGTELFAWGYDRGGRYSPARDEWIPATTEGSPGHDSDGPVWLSGFSMQWVSSDRVFLWLGDWDSSSKESCENGFVYDTVRDAWSNVDAVHCPVGRMYHSTVWTGDRMLVWGGVYRIGGPEERELGDGAIFDPATNRWSPMSANGAPSRRSNHTAVWTGTKMIIWGGWERTAYLPIYPEDHAIYDLATDTWTPMTHENAPPGCYYHTAVWTGKEMIVWGGSRLAKKDEPTFVVCEQGYAYDPALDRWRRISTKDAPTPRAGHTAVWTGRYMIIWGGSKSEYTGFSDGALYDPVTDAWQPTTMTGAPHGRSGHVAVWTGTQMLAWGGGTEQYPGIYGDGALYTP